MNELIGREIFAVGKWNDMEFTEADLDDIVANFERLNEIHKVPLKFGHNAEQEMTDGKPAIGWVSRVFREGKKLYADFTDMPRTVFEAIKNKLYRTVSVELLFDVDHKGKRFSHVLDAVALLGADHPAVNTLADLDALLATRTSFAGGRRLCFEAIAGKKAGGEIKQPPKTKSINREEIDMDEKQIEQMIAKAVSLATEPLAKSLEEVTKERNDFKTKVEVAEKEKAEFDANQRTQKIVAARKTVTELLDASVRTKTMSPAMREIYSRQIGLDDDKRVLDIDVDEVKLMCSVTSFDKDEQGRDGDTTREVTDASKELTDLTRRFMAEHNEQNFARALESVARANPKLHKQYLDNDVEA